MGMWIEGDPVRDSHVGFCGLLSGGPATIQVFASCPFRLYLNGEWIGEGPVRWSKSAPEFQEFDLPLRTGSNVIGILAHYEGVSTRMMEAMPPFVQCRINREGQEIAVSWKALRIGGFTPEIKRINPQFGWIDWCDMRGHNLDWLTLGLHETEGSSPKAVSTGVGAPTVTEISFLVARRHSLKPLSHGVLTERFGYDSDEPQAQFFLRDLQAHHGPPQGVWRRYDLGRIRLGRPELELDLPAGSIVEFAYSEYLVDGRVCPWITLSAGPSCNLDRFVARGGKQFFTTSTPKAGRFLEVHVISQPEKVHFIAENFAERSYHGDPEGSFHCSDKRLEQIWHIGAETHRACTEDSVIDNPTRERGEWIGDSLTVGLENASVTYADLKLIKKGLRQAAHCARADGLVAGLCPGTTTYLSTYACHWVCAAIRYFELTGDLDFLMELYPVAVRNLHVFSSKLTDTGLIGDLGWAFIDWGYVSNEGQSDMGLNILFLAAARSMVTWSQAVGEDSSHSQQTVDKVQAIIARYLESHLIRPNPWNTIGLQRTVLALRAGLIVASRVPDAINFIKNHYVSCFPNDLFAPHLADPATAQPRLITPFFSHFALSALWEHGEADFVLDQYRTCWGWALDQGLTTWPEVFDLRWSHCHQWSGCPTWQLTRYVLGVWPRQDLGPRTFAFRPIPCSLSHATAILPIPNSSQLLTVTYQRSSHQASWDIHSTAAFQIQQAGVLHPSTQHFQFRQTLTE